LRSNEDGQMLKQERRFFIQRQSLIPIRAFSVAEAMIALLIGSLILGYSAPMIAKQIKHNNMSDVQVQVLSRKIEELRRTQTNIPAGAIMFFNLRRCPTGWDPVSTDFIGHYPRIVGEDDDSTNTTVEQMVHKHKHVSPFLPYYGLSMKNQLRYGPYSYPSSLWTVYPNMEVSGDGGNYPQLPNIAHSGSSIYVPSGGKVSNSAVSFYGVGYNGEWHYNTIAYTSDGVNTTERLFGIKDGGATMMIKNFTVCPNRDENNAICKPSGNNYSVPYLANMPLVGNENRPNSVKWLACQKSND